MKSGFIKKWNYAGIVLGLLLANSLWAFDNPIVREIQPRNRFNQYYNSLYDLSGNPAFYKISYPDNLDFNLVQTTNDNNSFRRQYDPRRQENYELQIHSIKHLNERATLVSAIRYNRLIQHDIPRSLEKNIYEEYFSYLDTTTGTTVYDGPQINFIYDYALISRLHLGIEVNYGVEQSLKDVYTQCEIIARNTELRPGLSYISGDRKTLIGISGNFYDAQRKYEAVKYLQDAFVRTLFGYHLFMDETPKSTNRKNDDREGRGFALQFCRQDFVIPGLKLTLTGEYNGRSDDVTAGSVSTPTARGYWVREVRRGIFDLNYSPEKAKNSLELTYEIRQTDDWAKSGEYNVVMLDNAERLNVLSIRWQSRFFKRLITNTGASFAVNSCDYQEYTIPFRYNENDNHFSAFLDVKYAVNQILSVYLRGDIAKNDLYFYWDADRATRRGSAIGLERLTTLGRLGAELEYCRTAFDEPHQYDESFGLKILYWK
ncbi:MAG: hypothetical protein COT43_07740 [Candidatus Marinimicrobia bacterium CG08_land_8_20_14_0_20_45_22]|nr:MAG: hypothetical protein COT43_07740 [Candidatus Marinimicrobia bacterium CG08_land_8_20_14_0_20_45_22]